MKDVVVLIFVKDADSRRFCTREFHQIEVVKFAFGDFLLGERGAVVVVEVGSV